MINQNHDESASQLLPNMPWHVYIIECKDGKLYTGITNNLERRLHKHNIGTACRFTKYRNPVTLLYREERPTKNEALQRESQIKKLTKEGKLALIKEV